MEFKYTYKRYTLLSPVPFTVFIMKKTMLRFTVSFLFALLLLPTGCTSGDQPSGEDPTSAKKTSLSYPVISQGEKVDLADHAVKGKHTVFKFTADW